MASENEDPVPSSSGAGFATEGGAEDSARAEPEQSAREGAASPPMPFEPGHVIHGKYELLKPLGSGGVGYVVAARHIGFDDLVALKFLRPEFATHQEAVSRFTIEARASFRLRSEHVARMLDVDIYAGVPFIVMELLEGTDLRNLLETRRVLDLTLSVDYLIQACEALAAAHAIGVIHRDIKPENLFLLGNGEAADHLKVLDFGISKVAVRGENMRTNHALTRMAVGTPPYMSPEQVRASSALDARSDIWSVGCVLYELLTGTAPFDRVSLMQACAAVLEDEPPAPRELNGRIPQALSDVIMRCLRKDPSERFTDVADLAESLSHFGTERMASYPARCRAHLSGEGQGRRSTPPSLGDDRRSSISRMSSPFASQPLGSQMATQIGGQMPSRSITVRLESHAPLTRRENSDPTPKPAFATLSSIANETHTLEAATPLASAAASPVANENVERHSPRSDVLAISSSEREELERLYVPRRSAGQVLAWCVPVVVGGLLATYLATAEQHVRSAASPSLRPVAITDTTTDVSPAAQDSLPAAESGLRAGPSERPLLDKDRDKPRRQAQDALPSGTAEVPAASAAASAEQLAAAGAGPRPGNLNDAQADQARSDAAHGSSASSKKSSLARSAESKAKSRASMRSVAPVKPVEPSAVARPQADPDVGF